MDPLEHCRTLPSPKCRRVYGLKSCMRCQGLRWRCVGQLSIDFGKPSQGREEPKRWASLLQSVQYSLNVKSINSSGIITQQLVEVQETEWHLGVLGRGLLRWYIAGWKGWCSCRKGTWHPGQAGLCVNLESEMHTWLVWMHFDHDSFTADPKLE